MNSNRVPSPALIGTNQHNNTAFNSNNNPTVVRNLGNLLGWWVKLKLNENGAEDRWVEGKIWCYDPVPGVVILESPGTSKGRLTYRMIKVNQIKDLQVGDLIDPIPPNSSSIIPKILEPVRPINVTAIAMREAHAVKADDARRARIGHGVSRWAQEIFDALGKTLPVRWHQTSIIILDDVLLTGPNYRSEDIKMSSNASGNNNARMNRVKQVLDGEWARLLRTDAGKKMELDSRNSSTATTTNINSSSSVVAKDSST